MTNHQTRAAVREMQAIAQAQAEVAPVVGAVVAMDSAAGVYIEACKRLGVPDAALAGVQNHTDGARTFFDIARQRHRARGNRLPAVAMDAATEAEHLKMFPHANRLHQGF